MKGDITGWTSIDNGIKKTEGEVIENYVLPDNDFWLYLINTDSGSMFQGGIVAKEHVTKQDTINFIDPKTFGQKSMLFICSIELPLGPITANAQTDFYSWMSKYIEDIFGKTSFDVNYCISLIAGDNTGEYIQNIKLKVLELPISGATEQFLNIPISEDSFPLSITPITFVTPTLKNIIVNIKYNNE